MRSARFLRPALRAERARRAARAPPAVPLISSSSDRALRPPDDDLAPPRTSADAPPRSPARGSGRARRPPRAARTSAQHRSGPRARARAARAGRARAPRSAARSRARAPRPSTERRSLRAAFQPIETWSSCIADDGIESTLAGTASRFISLTIDACVYCAIMCPESTPGSSARNGGSPCERAVSSIRSVRRSLIEARSAAAIARKSSTYATGAPWKLPLRLDPPVRQHHRVVDRRGELARRHRLRVRERVAHRAGDLRRAAQRVRVLHARRRRPGARRRWPSPRAGASCCAPRRACPGCGRSACRSAAKTRSVPSSASTLIAAVDVRDLHAARAGRRARAPASPASRRCR